MADTARKPEGWDKLRRHDDPDGMPEVGYDPRRPGNYTVLANGDIKWDQVPDGYHFEAGRLVPKENAVEAPTAPDAEPTETPDQIIGTEEQPSSIPLTGEEAVNV